ncbi:histidine phosphatase family protein [Pleomorphovibrio marinus]|uniref:histidine phosphatase family protein n=1 Tax=Pleomorphovibrio marinus TaxID=2164132 RepID=UPI000E0AFEF4|nr:histidine phosphatase family protein [Pleomorphovibrio marinus]
MSSKKIFVVRHGQTDYNLKGVVQGSGIDAPINENGIQQAQAFFKKYGHMDFDKIYFSGLVRTKQSIAGFIEKGIPHESIPELNEISWGKYEGMPMNHDENEYYHNMISKWAKGHLDLKIENGESPLDVAERLEKGMKKILSEDHQKVLICMHGRAIRILLCVLLNYDLRFMDVFRHQNLCCYELSLLGDKQFRLDDYKPSPFEEENEL